MLPSFIPNRKLLIFGDVFLILFATQLSPWVRFGKFSFILKDHTVAGVFTLLLYIAMLYIFDLYNPRRTLELKDTSFRTAIAALFAFAGSTMFFYSFPSWKFGRGVLLIQAILVWIFFTGWRLVFSWVFYLDPGKKDVFVLGAGKCAAILCSLLEYPLSPYQVAGLLDDDPLKTGKMVGSVKVIGITSQLDELATSWKIKTVILAITKNRTPSLTRQLMESRLKGLEILDMPEVYEQLTRRIPVEHIRDDWIIFAPGFYLIVKDHIQKIKRLFDFGISSLLLIAGLPIMAATALAIRIDSPGPVFFKQTRVGKDGRTFTLWKFRSMHSNAEENGAVWTGKQDSRITRVGKWIRLLRIDELPQLINVFRGEMSVIGPRPERPEFIELLREKIPYYCLRHAVCPGITGWAQVNYRYGASVEDARFKLEYDLYYIKNMSLLLDVKILLRTVGIVLFGQGAR